jgi:hypothetical protein
MLRTYAALLAGMLTCLPLRGGTNVASGTQLPHLAELRPVFHWEFTAFELLLMWLCLVLLCLIRPQVSGRERAA